jgi:glutathione synthase
MQEYLSNVAKNGDKRVILLNGKVLTQFTKLPEGNSVVTNLAAGGEAISCTLTKREKEISQAVGGLMKKNGIFLAGLDIADEKLLEVNITSPTGLVAASKLYNKDYAKIVVDEIEKKLR